MSAKEPLDLRMTTHDCGQILRIPHLPIPAHVMIADVERRMMDEEDRWPIGLQPDKAPLAEDALSFPRRNGIKRHKTNWIIVDRVMKEVAAPGQVPEIAEYGADAVVTVAVAGRQEERRSKLGQDLAQMRIFVRGAVMHAVPRVDDSVHPLAIDVRNAAPQVVAAVRAHNILRRLCQDVSVADLRDDYSTFLSMQ